MLLVAVLTPTMAIGAVVAIFVLLPAGMVLGPALALGIGALALLIVHHTRKEPPGTLLTEQNAPDVVELVDRLCALADIDRPQVWLSDQRQPNSWVVHLPHRAPRLYLTQGLLDLLSPEELQAVIGHELAHIANRDALVMSVVGMPSAIMLRASSGGLGGIFLVLIGVLSSVSTSVLSRYRELAADAGSATITGRPSALASALLKVSDAVTQIPKRDLRAAASMNSFNLVPVASTQRWWRRRELQIGPTHPPLQKRLDALHALERDQGLPAR